MVPEWGLYPMVALAALATIVASQALISAVFSLTSQAAQLGLSPRVNIVHTSASTIGQIYIPTLNWVLMIATISVVLLFGSSDALAAAFGLAVSTTMAITTMLFAATADVRWHWPKSRIALVAGGFLIADLAFVAANTLKFAEGGWLPVAIGGFVFLIMFTWFTGNRVLRDSRKDTGIPLDYLISSLALAPPPKACGTAVFLAEETENVPTVLLHHLKHNQVLHETVILLTLLTDEAPRLKDEERISVKPCGAGFTRIVARYGYMEQPNVPAVLELASKQAGIAQYEPMNTSFYLGRESLILPQSGSLAMRWLLELFNWLRKNENDATSHFGIPPNRVVEMGARLELAPIRHEARLEE
jgi:KUP system potassium uptake protein